MFSTSLIVRATDFLQRARSLNIKVATAESCTGGLVAGLLTEIPGSSDVVDRGFVVYSNVAKQQLLNVPAAMLDEYGAVSAPVVTAMCEGALANSVADIAVAITGIAGPGGGRADRPVGLVYFAAARRDMPALVEEQRFGDLSRRDIRIRSVANALALLERMI